MEKTLGVKFVYKRGPWKRVLENDLKMSLVDGAFAASYKKEREAFGLYPATAAGTLDESRRLSTVTYSYYKLKGSPLAYNGKDLTGLKGNIGVPLGYSLAGDLKKLGLAVEEAGNTPVNFEKLALGRIGAVAVMDLAGDKVLQDSPKLRGLIEKIPTPIVTKGYYIMLSRGFVEKNKALAEKIWDQVKLFRETKLGTVIQKY